MHRPEGTGKNLFFSAIRKIYGPYGGIFDRTQLESQYNDWASGKLFMIGNEVVARAELYHQQGRLKTMLTEAEWQVNAKFLPARIEANHCNFVFFSNRVNIAKLDRDDRRYCVVWTPPPLSAEFYREVAEEQANGGVAALHHYLLQLDLGDFGPHTKPTMTEAKVDLIGLGMDSVDQFWAEWQSGQIPLPFAPALSSDVYEAYRHFCAARGGKGSRIEVLIATIRKRPNTEACRGRYLDGSNCRQARFIFPQKSEPPPGKSLLSWLTDCAQRSGIQKAKIIGLCGEIH